MDTVKSGLLYDLREWSSVIDTTTVPVRRITGVIRGYFGCVRAEGPETLPAFIIGYVHNGRAYAVRQLADSAEYERALTMAWETHATPHQIRAADFSK